MSTGKFYVNNTISIPCITLHNGKEYKNYTIPIKNINREPILVKGIVCKEEENLCPDKFRDTVLDSEQSISVDWLIENSCIDDTLIIYYLEADKTAHISILVYENGLFTLNHSTSVPVS